MLRLRSTWQMADCESYDNECYDGDLRAIAYHRTTIGILMSNIGVTLMRRIAALREIGFVILSAKEKDIYRTNMPATNGASEVIPTINMTSV